jgi:hypothetical protein
VGKLFDDQDGVEERRSGAAPLFRHFDPHDAQLEKAFDQTLIQRGFAIHRWDERSNFLDGEVADALLEHLLLFGEMSERSGRRELQGVGGHGNLRMGRGE